MKRSILALFIVFITSVSFAGDVLISDNSYHITKEPLGDSTIFTIEYISKFKNNFSGKYPNIDFATIVIDINRNSLIDAHKDRYYSSLKENICAGFLISKTSTTTCGASKSKARVFHYFLETEANPMPHPIIKYQIPNTEISSPDGNSYIAFKIHSAKDRHSYYPSRQAVETLSTTYKIKL